MKHRRSSTKPTKVTQLKQGITLITAHRPAPRNPFVVAAHARRAGSHRLDGGARRQQAKRELHQQLRPQPQHEALARQGHHDTSHRHSP